MRQLPQIVISCLWLRVRYLSRYEASVDCLSELDRFSISVLSAFRVRPEILVNLPYSAKILLNKSSEFFVITAISSAYARVLILQSAVRDSSGMFWLISILRIRGSIAIMNSAQLKASPCLTPLLIENGLDKKPFICTCARRLLCKILTAEMKLSGNPYALKVLLMYT